MRPTDMKNSPITTVLLVALAILSVWSAISCVKFISRSRELRRLQNAVGVINARQAGINALVNDAVEYSKKNSAIDPILESIGAKATHTNSAAAAKPAGK